MSHGITLSPDEPDHTLNPDDLWLDQGAPEGNYAATDPYDSSLWLDENTPTSSDREPPLWHPGSRIVPYEPEDLADAGEYDLLGVPFWQKDDRDAQAEAEAWLKEQEEADDSDFHSYSPRDWDEDDEDIEQVEDYDDDVLEDEYDDDVMDDAYSEYEYDDEDDSSDYNDDDPF